MTVGSSATPTEMATMRMLRLSNLTLARVRMPAAATIPNRAIPAPPSTARGTPSTMAEIFGMSPRMMRMPPAAVAT